MNSPVLWLLQKDVAFEHRRQSSSFSQDRPLRKSTLHCKAIFPGSNEKIDVEMGGESKEKTLYYVCSSTKPKYT